MTKWFKRSLMALGALFLAFIPVAIAASSEGESFLDTLGVGMMLVAFLLSLIVMITGMGAAFEWVSSRSGDKAKRGMVYEDAMLNRIMKKLSDEERGYLESYLNTQPYETVDGFDYIIDEENSDHYS